MKARPGVRDMVTGLPCVPVLVADLLLHLLVCEDLQERAPAVGLVLVPDRHLHCGQRRLAVTQTARNISKRLKEVDGLVQAVNSEIANRIIQNVLW